VKVSWTTPDDKKRDAAIRAMRHRVKIDTYLTSHPDLDATIEHHGIIIGRPIHVAAHHAVDTIRGSLPESRSRFVPERWICLVACDDGSIVEMDPRELKIVP